jgi:hypothetical protein
MLFDLTNPLRATRIVFDAQGQQIRVAPGETIRGLDLPPDLVRDLFKAENDLRITQSDEFRSLPAGGAVALDSMWGIGDNLHHRAVIRELMKEHEVWLTTCHYCLFHDLIDKGLHVIFKSTRLRAQARTIERERGLFVPVPAIPDGARYIKLFYHKGTIDIYGSILEAQAGICGIDHKKPLDFSLPVPPSWHEKLGKETTIDTGGKPLMVYRPIVLRREWNSANRNPHPDGYTQLFNAAREGFFVLSLADLAPNEEWIVGPEAPADMKLHRGELSFEAMAALFERAQLVFCNAGFAPVLAQAVGTPSICVYGGRESYGTTQRAGEHLAPTLGIDPIKPCDCHTERHDCGSKQIDMPLALDRVRVFAEIYRRPGGSPLVAAAAPTLAPPAPPAPQATAPLLVFGTIYVDSKERQRLAEQWLTLHSALNPDCDLLLVDSNSPLPLTRADFAAPKFEKFNFGDNVGHLSRKGRDGWGRAFCKGLDLACERGYEHVAHVEGDSLLRVPVRDLVASMIATGKSVASIPVHGMDRDIPGWVETGLMFFSTSFLRRSQFTRRYDWRNREVRPTPEVVVRNLIGDDNLLMLPLRGLRGDKNQVTHGNIVSLNLDWVTHCHNDIWAYDRFVEANLPDLPKPENHSRCCPGGPGDDLTRNQILSEPKLKINLGCGTNKLAGWENHDADVDITRRLPWPDNCASYIFIEHCVEHVSLHQAVHFFEEACRVAQPGGVFRVTVPSIERIMESGDQAYFAFTSKWSGEATAHGAAKAILFSHGHQTAWTASLMASLLRYAGFVDPVEREVGESPHPELRGVEGHGKVIGDAFNRIESMCFEATKPAVGALTAPGSIQKVSAPIQKVSEPHVAVVVGGAIGVMDEVKQTVGLLGDMPTRWFVANDMIPRFPLACTAVTLHPMKLAGWLGAREQAGFPKPDECWAHSRGDARNPWAAVTHVADDWRGSSGLFGVAVARQLGFGRIILCGVPMSAEGGHFLRGSGRWNAQASFLLAWQARRAQLAPYVRSWSGWTAEAFGRPSHAFLEASAEKAA